MRVKSGATSPTLTAGSGKESFFSVCANRPFPACGAMRPSIPSSRMPIAVRIRMFLLAVCRVLRRAAHAVAEMISKVRILSGANHILARFPSRSEGLDAGDRDGVERLDESNHKVHGAVEVGAVDNSVVGVGRAGGDKDRGDRNATIVELDGAGIIAEAGNEIELQGDVLVGSNLFDMRDEVAVGKFAEGIEHHAWAATQNLLRRFRAGAGDVVGDADLQAEADIGIDDARGGSRTTHLDAAFFLDGADTKDLVGVGRLGEAAHDFKHDGAADAVIPSFSEIAVVGENGEIGNGCDGIAR